MLTILVFVIILGVLVFVHELGHFVVAIRNGIKADEFGFGFPPRVFGLLKNEKTGKYEIVWGNKNVESKNTVYSLNWIPVGGFVKIKGEDGHDAVSPNSFASKSAWIRAKVLLAGVTMNFLLGWVLLSAVFYIGMPEVVGNDEIVSNFKIQISEVTKDSPAHQMGVEIGDQFLGGCGVNSRECVTFSEVKDVQEFIEKNKGEEIALRVKRGDETQIMKGVPRESHPGDQGALGVGLVKTTIKDYSFFDSVWNGLLAVFGLIVGILNALWVLFKGLLVGNNIGMQDVSGPVGIAVLTKQVTEMGINYLLQFTAVLSINLGIINILPIPALDGGRVFFILIEKLKGSPVSQKFENLSHTVGFFLLISLMVVVTLRDFVKFDIVGKIMGIF